MINQNAEYVYAMKGKHKTYFTPTIWKNMGKVKMGWIQISKEQFENDSFTVETDKPKSVKKDEGTLSFKEIAAQAKGFEADGKLEQALGKYKAALALKPTNKNLAKKIAELEEQVGPHHD